MYDAPSPLSSVGHTYYSFTMDKKDEGIIIVGQVTSYQDIGSVSTTASAPSGFIFGLDSLNSCVIFDSNWAPTEEVGYTSLSATYSSLGSGGHGITTDSTYSYTDTRYYVTSGYTDASGDFSGAKTEFTGACTLPSVFPPTNPIETQYYVIQSSMQTQDVTYDPFTIEPSVFDSYGC